MKHRPVLPILRSTLTPALIAAVLATGASSLAQASSDEAWREFRAEVEKTCRAAADNAGFTVKTVAVDPFGSQNQGLARLVGHERGSERRQQLLCAYDKQARQAEVGTPMAIKP